MAASPPPKALSDRGGARISLFLETDLGTHLALNAAADSTIRALKRTPLVASFSPFLLCLKRQNLI
jgi:hypothetical protein